MGNFRYKYVIVSNRYGILRMKRNHRDNKEETDHAIVVLLRMIVSIGRTSELSEMELVVAEDVTEKDLSFWKLLKIQIATSLEFILCFT